MAATWLRYGWHTQLFGRVNGDCHLSSPRADAALANSIANYSGNSPLELKLSQQDDFIAWLGKVLVGQCDGGRFEQCINGVMHVMNLLGRADAEQQHQEEHHHIWVLFWLILMSLNVLAIGDRASTSNSQCTPTRGWLFPP